MKYTLGIDEVGRGCLAGPVYMASVILDNSYPLLCSHADNQKYKHSTEIDFIRDSKKLNETNRNRVLELAISQKVSYQIVHASNKLIDKFGMGACLSHIIGILVGLNAFPEQTNIIIDGKITLLSLYNEDLSKALFKENKLVPFDLPNLQRIEILRENKADDKYLAVAMASNVAKVIRDNHMKSLSLQYPEFGWDKNKGYGTMVNREAIKKDMENPYLRQSYLGNIRKSNNV